MSLFSSTRLALNGTRVLVNVRMCSTELMRRIELVYKNGRIAEGDEIIKQVSWMYVGESGSGAGKGGGGGGSIRQAGGSLGKMGAAREDQYFNQKQKEQLKVLKDHLDDEIEHHRRAIKRHEEAIQRHEAHLTDMTKKGLGK